MQLFKSRILLFLTLVFGFSALQAQITVDPPLPTADDAVTITFDATQGDGDMAGYTGDVYTHTGVYIEGLAGWRNVIGGWGDNDAQPQLTRIDTDLYELEILPSIREFYNVPMVSIKSPVGMQPIYELNENILIEAGENNITSMNFVFRTADASGQTDDLFVDVVSSDSHQTDSLLLLINEILITSTTESNLSHEWQVGDYGSHHIRVLVYSEGNVIAEAEKFIYVLGDTPVAPLPDNVKKGINYLDDTSVTLVLHDPPALKEFIFVIGDFNDWELSEEYHMNRTPDGTHYWLTITDLEPDTEYGFQYYIDGELRLADPYTHKVLDPWNDRWISNFNYPDLKAYPDGKTTGLVSIMHPGRPVYEWQTNDFTPPAVEDMVIYELLIRDFVDTQAIKTVMDSLDYLQNLGVNVIELMPVNQFGGNISWGYNPVMYFATDKAYGTREDYKRFIDAAHERGMAVVLDIVLNHSDDHSPWVQMYFNPNQSRPAPENPWYLETCPHEPWCWFQTFDQDSEHTHELFNRIVQYWITEFRIDGFRFDFTKGFTNQQTGGQGWEYDAARVANLKRIADEVWEVNPDAYVILEHFTHNDEEKVLSDYGMLLWGNVTHPYQEAAMAWLSQSNFNWVSYQNRGWADPHLIGYMESHDEEHIMYKNITYGNSSNPEHDIKDLTTALRRAELVAAFYFPIPGPKMIWQFGELGYDYSINHCQDGTIDDRCRTDPKPIRWDYFEDSRRRRVYDVYAMLANLKQEHDVFRTDDYSLSLSGAMKRIHLNHPSNNVTVLGNFGVTTGDITPNFQVTGVWHEFFSGDVLQVNDVNQPITLEPGEYRMYSTTNFNDDSEPPAEGFLNIYPNPARSTLFIEADQIIHSVEIIDIMGKRVLHLNTSDKILSLDTHQLRSGVYLLRLNMEDGYRTERLQVVSDR